MNSNIESNRRSIHALRQQAEGSITEIAACQARGEVHEDHISQLEREFQELVETAQTQAQLAENLQAQQTLGETSLKELREKADKKL